jgi:hypothetical protein
MNVTIISSTGTQAISGSTVYTCSSVGGYPSTNYSWFNGTSLIQTGPQLSIKVPGNLSLTCVASSSLGQSTCAKNQTLSTIVAGLSMLCSTFNRAILVTSKLIAFESDVGNCRQ